MSKSDLFTKVLLKMWFESAFPTLKLDDLEKEDLVTIIMELKKIEEEIKILKDPKSHMTSMKLVRLYIKSYRFTPLQKRLLNYLSDGKPKSYSDICKFVYKHKNKTSGKSAFNKLLLGTKKAIELSGSANVFRIVFENKTYQLVIDDAELFAIILNKQAQKFLKK